MILDKLKRFVRGMDSPTEAGSPRDGAFSYAAENHAFTWGFTLGFALATTYVYARGLFPAAASAGLGLLVFVYSNRRQKAKGVQVPDYVYKQASKEPHYYSGGYVLGVLAGILVVLGLPVLAAVVAF